MFAVRLGGFCKHLPDQQSKCVPINSSFLEKEERGERKTAYTIFIYRRITTDFNNIFSGYVPLTLNL